MSRLDMHICQKIAQRDFLNLAAQWLARSEGTLVEFGLSSGRSYSHLVEHFPGREIFCFDRLDKTHPLSRPPADHLILGEFTDLLQNPALQARFAGRVILVHIDIGCGEPVDDWMPEFVLDRMHGWLKPGAVILSDQDLTLAPAWRLDRVDATGQVEYADRFFCYRRRPD